MLHIACFNRREASLRKLKGYDAKLIKDIVQKDNALIEINNKKYYLSLIEEPEKLTEADAESDPELKQKEQQTKKSILNGKSFAIDDVVELIDQGKL